MSLAPGSRLGAYEVLAPLGHGGMGEVYRARDTRLGRDVAIKILPEMFSADADRVARFQREAHVLASLNHPHIAQIYGTEDAGAGKALVLELVDGPTLADRIDQGPIPFEEAFPIARQIAAALEAAHESGIIHRDLKPANIKLTADGTVKVLDFGLAKALGPDHGPAKAGHYVPNLSASPTITSPAHLRHGYGDAGSMPGVILGTAVYMSPEQAKGKPVDKRSDIWAFGCVLFEMLTGKRAFDGEDLTDVVAAVVRGDPDWSALPTDVPAHIRTLLKGCLEKDRNARLSDIAVVRYLLEQSPPVRGRVDAVADAIAHRRPWPWMFATAAAMLISVASLALAWRMGRREDVAALPMRIASEIGADLSLLEAGVSAVISPDGTAMALVGLPAGAGTATLHVRRLDQLQATPLAGTDGAFMPVFSPDGSAIAFFAQGKLKKVAITGGAPVVLCDSPNGRGLTWSDDGWIYFTADGGPNQSIQRVRVEGGAPEVAVKRLDSELSLRWPHILPGGKVLLFTPQPSNGNFETASIVAYSFVDGTRKVVLQGGFNGRYVRSGHLLYGSNGQVFAAPFDPVAVQLTGRAVPVVQGVSNNANIGSMNFSASDSGTLVYVAGDSLMSRAPIGWIDRTGKTQTLRSTASDWSNPSFAPDGRRLAIDISDGSQTDVWVYEWARDTLSRLTFDSANDARPVWSPSGRYIAFASTRNGASNLYLQRADGTGDVQRLTESKNAQFPSSWHPSGKYLAYFETVPGQASNVLILPLEGDDATGWKPGTPQVFLAGPFTESSGMFSPDGRWIAYLSNESGRNEIYIRPFPGPGGKWQISTAPADDPTWSKTAPEFFFLSTTDLRLMNVKYRVQGDSFQADKPVAWLNTRLTGRPRPPSRDLDLHPDGTRFATASADEQSSTQQNRVVFVFNFFDELRRLSKAGIRD